ncbi:hypothetical protein HYV44_00525 [Candidatus Microgenomates bacterium]|nr:hypothetical protein [Candidatus Microgenomates bacterium]
MGIRGQPAGTGTRKESNFSIASAVGGTGQKMKLAGADNNSDATRACHFRCIRI